MSRALEVLGLELEGVLEPGRRDDRLAPVDRDHLGIADPIVRGDDHLVALVHRDEERVVEDPLAAGADDRVGGLVVERVLPLELGGDRLAQRRNAEHRRILGLAAPDRGDGGFLDVVGRVEIRLADRKRNDVPPLRLQVPRLLRHRHGRGRFYAREDVGEEGHGRPIPLRYRRNRGAQHKETGARRQRVCGRLARHKRCPACANRYVHLNAGSMSVFSKSPPLNSKGSLRIFARA